MRKIIPPLIKVSNKGQILIPVQLRKAFNIKPSGYVVAYPTNEEKLIIEAVDENPINAACGLLADKSEKSWSKELVSEREKEKQKEESQL